MARASSEHLRRRLVGELRAKGVIRSAPVAAAFLSVPRERFLPAGVDAPYRDLKGAYRDEAIVTKRDERGLPLSSSSQPSLMAQMLELLDARPGDRVLEIGAGTGYNAALLAHIVGPRGAVTTVDVDPAVARQARRSIREAGYRARVLAGDGRLGHAGRMPYDRIIVTACADEISTAWIDQLAEGGRLELPLRLDPDGAAIQVIPVLERRGGRLRSVGVAWGGFMPLHGGDGGWRPPPSSLSAGRSAQGRHTSLASLSGAGLIPLPADGARRMLASLLVDRGPPRRQGLTGMSSRRPPLLFLYLLLAIPAGRRVSLNREGRISVGLVDPADGSLAVVSARSPWRAGDPAPDRRARWRLDAYGGERAAAQLQRLLDRWQALRRHGEPDLRITAANRRGRVRLTFDWSTGDS